MNKTYRQSQIVRLIKKRKIVTQEQLAQELSEAGLATTQVTLSRDVRELGLVKTADGYRQVEGATPVIQFETVAGAHLQEVRSAQNLIVLRTAPGHASLIAVALDQQEWPEVVGTIAGDDTILVITPDAETAARLRSKFLELLRI